MHLKADESLGLYAKYCKIERTDGRSAPGEDHEDCDYFVLDITHDPFALPALHAYANACESEYPELANDLRVMADSPPRSSEEGPTPRIDGAIAAKQRQIITLWTDNATLEGEKLELERRLGEAHETNGILSTDLRHAQGQHEHFDEIILVERNALAEVQEELRQTTEIRNTKWNEAEELKAQLTARDREVAEWKLRAEFLFAEACEDCYREEDLGLDPSDVEPEWVTAVDDAIAREWPHAALTALAEPEELDRIVDGVMDKNERLYRELSGAQRKP